MLHHSEDLQIAHNTGLCRQLRNSASRVKDFQEGPHIAVKFPHPTHSGICFVACRHFICHGRLDHVHLLRLQVTPSGALRRRIEEPRDNFRDSRLGASVAQCTQITVHSLFVGDPWQLAVRQERALHVVDLAVIDHSTQNSSGCTGCDRHRAGSRGGHDGLRRKRQSARAAWCS